MSRAAATRKAMNVAVELPSRARGMQYRLFGRTGMRVSALGLGCAGFGGVGSVPELVGKGEDRDTAFALMDRAWEAGINYFDSANSYGGGASETMIGDWVRSRGHRDQLVVSTKVFSRVGPGPNDAGLSRRHIMQQVEGSLRRLQTDYLDLYTIHSFDPDTAIEETLGALDDLVHAGKVRYLGASNLPAWRLTRALWVSAQHHLTSFESIQNEYSLLERSIEAEVLPLAAEQNLAVTAFSPTAGGWVSGKYRPGEPHPPGSRMTLRPEPYQPLETDRTYRAIGALAAAAAERGLAPITLALAWVISHQQVTAALIGPRSVEHFDTLLPALDLSLGSAERDALSARMEAAKRPPGVSDQSH
jgi:aryl-alcohol dehydrogenase-like predicted oxidoreductase